MGEAAHWDDVYGSRDETSLGWYEPTPSTLNDVVDLCPHRSLAILDIGAGTGRLADELLDRSFIDITLVDPSSVALDRVRQRLTERPEPIDGVGFVVASVQEFEPTRLYDLWHDRAVFHFFVDAEARAAYKATLSRSVRSGGHVVIATFASDGPASCAGLPVRRYSDEMLRAEFANLDCLGCRTVEGSSGGGDQRPYVICRFRMP